MTGNIATVWNTKPDDTDPDNEMFTSSGGQSNVGILRPKKRPSNQQSEDTDDTNTNNSTPADNLENISQAQQAQGVSTTNQFKDAIYVYKNGYKIGDGEFKDNSDPRHAKFLEELNKGEIPHELEPVLRIKFGKNASQMGVDIVNRKTQMYKPEAAAAASPSKPQFQAFKGQGHGLGRSTSETMGQTFENCTAQRLAVDATAPQTRIQIILVGGKREAIKINVSATVLQLYMHVKAISGYNGQFQLLAGFPPKPLTNASDTIESAKLGGSRITQKGI